MRNLGGQLAENHTLRRRQHGHSGQLPGEPTVVRYLSTSEGTPVYSLGEFQPGDLLLTPGADGTTEHPGHVGMFIGTYHGEGLVVQAPETRKDIKITPLAGYWAQQTVAIRRWRKTNDREVQLPITGMPRPELIVC